jgi:hypothetical protein
MKADVENNFAVLHELPWYFNTVAVGINDQVRCLLVIGHPLVHGPQ